MANVKISALPAAGTLDGTEIVPIVDGGVTKRTTIADITGSAPGNNITSDVWISGANFAGNATGFENPGGAGNYVSYDFPQGQNRYGVADVAIPAGWNTFSITYFVSNTADANLANHYIFESSYQLAGQGSVLSPTVVAHDQSFLNTGVNALVVGLVTPNITVGGARLLNYLVRSNNATQEVVGIISLIGLLLTRVT
jgi:hypothetical protein